MVRFSLGRAPLPAATFRDLAPAATFRDLAPAATFRDLAPAATFRDLAPAARPRSRERHDRKSVRAVRKRSTSAAVLYGARPTRSAGSVIFRAVKGSYA
ncbi:Eukaryotic peptide chain release factor GTP-binding subunit [Actinoplanes sp. SE50]|nr:Eukaryotic peptide chain release factor GTP-binding subunit [Actinoplanes sp. SE50/110]ATO84234.1 Eukaryotic peptide chain release factor GTP-binding subunit [Actinoplanes sp. SE50]SLM01644.1 hypothetical protein ACSP50_4880 [Actinoplanes sp. SE50/110]